MKIKKNELLLIFILVYVLVIICGWNFLIKPQTEKTAELTAQFTSLQSEKSASDIKIANTENVKKDIDNVITEINNSSAKFFPKTENPELHINNIFNYHSDAKTKLIALEISQLKDDELSELYVQSTTAPVTASPEATTADATAAAADTTNADGSVTNVQTTTVAPTIEESKYTSANTKYMSVATVSVTVRGSMAQVIEFANKIQNVNQTIEINVVSIVQNEEDNTLYDATYSLNFVSAVDSKPELAD